MQETEPLQDPNFEGEAEGPSHTNRGRLEALEDHTNRLTNVLDEVTTTMAELRMAMNANSRDSEENRRTMNAIRRETNSSIERLERRLAEGRIQEKEPLAERPRQDPFVEGVETSVTGSMHAPSRTGYRRGGRVEKGPTIVERWIQDEGNHPRSPHRPQDVRYEIPRYDHSREPPYGREQEGEALGDRFERESQPYGREEVRPNHYGDLNEGRNQLGRAEYHGGRHDRRHQRDRYNEEYQDHREGNRAYDRGPKRPKVDFPKFSGGDPYEWLEKADHYFRTWEVPREERVETASFYFEGKASKWWRWIRDQYEKERRRLGWSAFEKEFLMQYGPSPIINHHGQLATLKQEGKVHD